MGKYAVACILLLFFIVGCTQIPTSHVTSDLHEELVVCNEPYIRYATGCCLDQNNNSICDNDEKTEKTKLEDASGLLPGRSFDIESLTKYINNMTAKQRIFRTDTSDTPYLKQLRGKGQKIIASDFANKYFVIQLLNSSTNKGCGDFYDFARANNWDGWRYYINETSWHFLTRPLSREELQRILPKYDYKDYIGIQSNWIDVIVRERPLQTRHGQIPQYEFLTMIMDQYGYWQGAWESFLYLLKVPCTQDTVVYIRPEWDINFGRTMIANQKQEHVFTNWEADIGRKQGLLIEYADKIMDFCGINTLPNMSIQAFSNQTKLVYNWKVFFRQVFKYSFSARAETQNETDGSFKIKSVNMTFVNYETSIRMDYDYLSVKMQINDSGTIKDYYDPFIKGGKLVLGEKITQYYERESLESFGRNATMILMPYLGWSELAEPKRYYIGSPLVLKIS